MTKMSLDMFSSFIEDIYVKEVDVFVDKNEIVRDDKVYKPELKDLYRLYSFVIDNSVISILEFGSGWSTLALAMGLEFNQNRFGDQYKGFDRNLNAFRMCSVDSSKYFSQISISRLNENQRRMVDEFISVPFFKDFQGYPVSLWDPVPRFDYDLIYLDAPEPEQIVANVSALPMSSLSDLPISADLCVNEPYILPGTSILIDGRTANVNFLEAKMYREWIIRKDIHKDISYFFLNEPPLGAINQSHLEFRKNLSLYNRLDNLI